VHCRHGQNLIEATHLVPGREKPHRLTTGQQEQAVMKERALVSSIERKMFENLAHNPHLRQTIIIFVHELANRPL
jgi:hypothetical protein